MTVNLTSEEGLLSCHRVYKYGVTSILNVTGVFRVARDLKGIFDISSKLAIYFSKER